jgi:hypothetical protein
MRNSWFPFWKTGIFSPGKEIKVLRGGVHRYAAQAKPKTNDARGKKHPFRMETIYIKRQLFLSQKDFHEKTTLNI